MDPASEAYETITSQLRCLGVKDIGKHVVVKRGDEEQDAAEPVAGENDNQDSSKSDTEDNTINITSGYTATGFSKGYATWKLTCGSSTKSHYLTGWQRPQCLDYCFTNL